MLIWIVVVNFSGLYSISLYGRNKIYPFHCSWTLGWVSVFMYNAAMKTLGNVSWRMCTSRSRIAELQGTFVFHFTRQNNGTTKMALFQCLELMNVLVFMTEGTLQMRLS